MHSSTSLTAAAAAPPVSGSSAPTEYASRLSDLFHPHVDSFNAAVDPAGGIDTAVESLPTISIDAVPSRGLPSFRYWIDRIAIGFPSHNDDSASTRLYPAECRSRGMSYTAPLTITFHRQTGDNGAIQVLTRRLGDIPVMVKSNRCNIAGMSADRLVQHHEERTESGGYFIVNGIERLIRLLILPRRHYIMAIVRPSLATRGPEYTPFACSIRCVRADDTSKTVTMHYLNTGAATVRVSIRKQEFFLPVLLLMRALADISDLAIYERILRGRNDDSWLSDRVEGLLRASLHSGLHHRRDVLAYFGQTFRILFRPEPSVSNEEVGAMMIRDHIFIHLSQGNESIANQNKLNLLIEMMQKLYSIARGHIKADDADTLACHEVLLPGQLYTMILKEKLEECLYGIKAQMNNDIRLNSNKVDLHSDKYFRLLIDQAKDIGKAIHYFIVTGNLITSTGLDLMQTSGFTVVAEKLNYFRYISHFRSIHRGQFFTTMKTTDVRKLKPESFGLICGVHTPDGAPCGLLNHLTHNATIITRQTSHNPQSVIAALTRLGLLPVQHHTAVDHSFIPVFLDGLVVGYVTVNTAATFVDEIRLCKVDRSADIDVRMEIYPIFSRDDGLFPSVYLYTAPSRIIRPVRWLGKSLDQSRIEWIGSQEQMTLDIAMSAAEYRAGETSHQELNPTQMLSVVASMTPFSDYNQSPRNMYQCLTSVTHNTSNNAQDTKRDH